MREIKDGTVGAETTSVKEEWVLAALLSVDCAMLLGDKENEVQRLVNESVTV